eukprot:331733-Chlamydomonas_euryale.AAC.9
MQACCPAVCCPDTQPMRALARSCPQIRVELAALHMAHKARAEQQHASHISHAVSMSGDPQLQLDTPAAPEVVGGLCACRVYACLHALHNFAHPAATKGADILALSEAIEKGAPLGRHVAALQAAATERSDSDTGIVLAATGSMPSSGVPTRSQLESEFRRTSKVLSQLSYFPGKSAGMLAHAVAKLAVALKMDETAAVGATCLNMYMWTCLPSQVRALHEDVDALNGVPGPTQDSAANSTQARLAVAEAALEAGNLRVAADVVEQATRGTAAETAAAAWVTGARSRAAADQSLVLLRAHASVLAASVLG